MSWEMPRMAGWPLRSPEQPGFQRPVGCRQAHAQNGQGVANALAGQHFANNFGDHFLHFWRVKPDNGLTNQCPRRVTQKFADCLVVMQDGAVRTNDKKEIAQTVNKPAMFCCDCRASVCASTRIKVGKVLAQGVQRIEGAMRNLAGMATGQIDAGDALTIGDDGQDGQAADTFGEQMR